MNVIDYIIEHRSRIMEIAAPYGVTALKLYGSCLVRREKPESDIDFLAVFDPNIPYKLGEAAELMDLLELVFDRRVSIVDSRNIPDVFRPNIEIEPVDIMTLEVGKEYTISPKSSRIYYYMLNKLFRDYNDKLDPEVPVLTKWAYKSLADRISWWFSRLLRLQDNDLKVYEGFDFVEVLYVCDHFCYELEPKPEDIKRLKALLPSIKDYVATRLPLYEK
ncbi:nucleotidyltransferase domain-containing protein [Paenibacillus dokdonensis]|uniref:Nucleotidyltransferase domain-containing protein n=1 Tax=Paenibacillus dokdonensis TaxID=2567944 RepID=A0ABU6GWR9_9BACL|nr:nucleotidyltransferase domain-containing protein [Paenibacillus dokdonensis]MEC0244157.1 nucleotidyltransferase domain-containing protein [Paenibacillus dokdonensis]